jgi:L-rhamnonate dehydratase
MQRRTFLSLPFAAALPAKPLPIADMEFVRLEGKADTIAGVDHQFQVQPLHVYDDLRPKPYKDGEPRPTVSTQRATYLRIKTRDGPDGLYGPIDSECVPVIQNQLKPFLVGKDALAAETLWDQMYRLNRHGRSSHFMMAISAVDNTLWDLRGRFFNAPVYRLLGGPTRAKVEAYGSCLGFSVELEAARRKSVELKNAGFRYQKWFMAYGPGDGPEGLQKCVDLVRVLRDAVGPNVHLMFDAFSGWQLDFAIAWAKQVESMHPRWIEEPFSSDKLEAFVALRRATSVPVATGEHFYGRWEANRFLAAGAISVVQADPEWCGGVSELMKICSIASLYDAQVMPHGHSLHAALHVVASQPPETCPLVEYLITKMRSYYFFEKEQLAPVNGYIELPDRPGFGIELRS